MSNWMEKYEKRKDEKMESELNRQLEKYLDLLDETDDDIKRKELIGNIIDTYDALRIDACDYDEDDYKAKKAELVRIKYKLMNQKHMEDRESQSWNEYREEERQQNLQGGDSER